MAYDKLGRMTARNEPDLNSTWTYDTATKGIGKLAVASSDNGYRRTHSYDSLGRISSTSTVIDSPGNPYVTATTYDAYGRVNTQTYPTGFAVKNVYNTNGYLVQVVNAATPTTVYWTANTMDAAGHLTQQTYGNNVVTQQGYNANTGRLESQSAGAGVVQNMSYTYDTLGNLKTRTDATQGLNEAYTYDTLNRLIYATAQSGAVNTATTYTYDSIGNLTCKSDISACTSGSPNYAYNASGANSVRPHAVASITGVINGVTNPTFGYDANGNMTAGAGRTMTWTSFNMPQSIVRGGQYDQFLYNGEHERIKESEVDGTTIVSLSPRYDTGIHFEKITKPNGVIEYEHFLYAGNFMFGQYERYATTAAPTTYTQTLVRYFHKDGLGSVVAITDEAGTVVERLSYDPFGKRRYPNGVADPNGLLTSTITEHGYTGHEHLDEVGVIHMNGRLYDPITARFMSADPYIQDPLNLQSYNRFSYCWENPVSCTDPSGYFSLKKLFRAVVVVAAVVITSGAATAAYATSYATATGAVAGTAAYSAAYTAAAASLTGSVIGGVAGGFTAGLLTSNGNLNDAAKGAITGAIFGGLDAYGAAKNFNAFQTTAANALAGGATAKMQGGSFAEGFKYSGISTASSEAYKYVVGYAANSSPGSGIFERGDRASPPELGNTVGMQGEHLTGKFLEDLFKEGGALSTVLNWVPGINAVSKLHDKIVTQYDSGTLMRDYIMNVPTMLPAAAVTYGGLMRGSLSVQLSVTNSR